MAAAKESLQTLVAKIKAQKEDDDRRTKDLDERERKLAERESAAAKGDASAPTSEQDAKRLADLQAELDACRKEADEKAAQARADAEKQLRQKAAQLDQRLLEHQKSALDEHARTFNHALYALIFELVTLGLAVASGLGGSVYGWITLAPALLLVIFTVTDILRYMGSGKKADATAADSDMPSTSAVSLDIAPSPTPAAGKPASAPKTPALGPKAKTAKPNSLTAGLKRKKADDGDKKPEDKKPESDQKHENDKTDGDRKPEDKKPESDKTDGGQKPEGDKKPEGGKSAVTGAES